MFSSFSAFVAFGVIGGDARGGDVKPACKDGMLKELAAFPGKFDKYGLGDILSGGWIVFETAGCCGIDEG